MLDMDFAISIGVVALLQTVIQPRHRWRTLFTANLVGLVVLGSMTLFRLGYYGELMPNTYYLKATGQPRQRMPSASSTTPSAPRRQSRVRTPERLRLRSIGRRLRIACLLPGSQTRSASSTMWRSIMLPVCTSFS